jgi:aspartate-semialdehyde dehydrogenase
MSKNQYRIAVVGATTLLGKEVGDEIAESPLASAVTVLLDSEDAAGTLEAVGEEAAFLQPLEPAALENVDVAIFTDGKMLREHGETARQLGAAVVDATGGVVFPAGVRSPLLKELAPLDLETTGVRVAHPVATMLAMVLGHAASAGTLRSAAATVLQPASENGRAALDELQQQAVNLLSFQSVPKDEFDAQVAFNLLPSLGESSRNPLEATRERIVEDFRQVGGPSLPEPFVQLIQAPVFHGFAVSLFFEFEGAVSAKALQAAFASENLDLVTDEGDPPSNLSAAGQGQILLQIRPQDTPSANGAGSRFAVWMVADNLKLAARTAVACALELTRLRPLGKVQ